MYVRIVISLYGIVYTLSILQVTTIHLHILMALLCMYEFRYFSPIYISRALFYLFLVYYIPILLLFLHVIELCMLSAPCVIFLSIVSVRIQKIHPACTVDYRSISFPATVVTRRTYDFLVRMHDEIVNFLCLSLKVTGDDDIIHIKWMEWANCTLFTGIRIIKLINFTYIMINSRSNEEYLSLIQ